MRYSPLHVAALAGLILAPAFVRAGEPLSYRNSRGRIVRLAEVPDRILIAPRPAAGARLRARPELDWSAPQRAWHGGLISVALRASAGGKTQALGMALREAGAIERTGLLFSTAGGGRFALDRQVLVHLSAAGPGSVPDWSALGLDVLGPLSADGRLILARAADARAALAASRAAAGQPGLDWILPDFILPVRLHRTRSDPYYDRQWYLSQPGAAHVHAEEAWELTSGDPQVVVAVVDTGVDRDHPDFAPGGILGGYNSDTQEEDATPLADALDAHGTACSGVIVAAADNGEGMAGLCPGCSLLPIKMLDGVTQQTQLSNGYRALRWAVDHGAWVISNSWGISEDYTGQVDMEPFYAAIRYAAESGRSGLGSVVLFASGNGDPYTGQAVAIGPSELAAMDEVMAVGGTGLDDTVVSYSNYGQELSVVAPTGGLDPTTSFGIFTTDTLGDRGFSRSGFFWLPGYWGDENTGAREPDLGGDYTAYFNGTSAACPIAAGVVALTLSANPALSAAQARLVVERTADRVGGAVYDGSGHNIHYGFGRVNAARAVAAARVGFDRPDGSLCYGDFNCAGAVCLGADGQGGEGLCATACVGDGDCLSGFACGQVAGQSLCLATCTNHDACSAGSVCLAGLCQQVACPDGPGCPAGTACPPAGGLCQVTCAADAECLAPGLCLPASGGDLCQAASCAAGGSCPAGTVCPPGGGDCSRPCADDAACPPPALCLETGTGKLCSAIDCADDQVCPAGSACPAAGGLCARPCARDGDCPGATLCIGDGDDGLCQLVRCAEASACPDGTRCLATGLCARDQARGGCACGRPAGSGLLLWVPVALLFGLRVRRRRTVYSG